MRGLRKKLLWALVFCAAAIAQAQNTVTVTASNIENALGQKLANGQACFQATTGIGGTPISFQMGGGGLVTNRPVCGSVTNGALSVTLPNTANTVPANVCLNFTVKDLSTNQIVLGAGNGNNGFGCLQPSGNSSQSSWCSGSSTITCNLDNYPPNLTALGIQGLQGPSGVSGTISIGAVTPLNGAAAPTVTNSGSSTAAVINFGIPRGIGWQGAWSSTTTYTMNQGVNYNGSSYVCLADSSLNQEPDLNPTVWQLVAAIGGSLSYPGISSDGSQGLIVAGRVKAGNGPISVLALSSLTGVQQYDTVQVYDSQDCATRTSGKAANCMCMTASGGTCSSWVAMGSSSGSSSITLGLAPASSLSSPRPRALIPPLKTCR